MNQHALTVHRAGVTLLLGLAAWCIAWEWFVAPIRPGGSWLVLKVIPLLLPLWTISTNAARRRYAYQWSTLVIWLYFAEGVVRAWSDISTISQLMALGEVLLSVGVFVAAVMFIRRDTRSRT